MKQVDSNGDACISLDEFVDFYLNMLREVPTTTHCVLAHNPAHTCTSSRSLT